MNKVRDEGFAWQVGVWDRMADTYQKQIDRRFGPVINAVMDQAGLRSAETILDLGTGTGSLAVEAAKSVGPEGLIIACDISTDMLEIVSQRVKALDISNVEVSEGRAEAIPCEDECVDAVLASLCLMYVIDRAQAAREIARVLRPGGRLVAAVWAGPDDADIVLFQQTAGSFAPTPPVSGVGPGALAELEPFLTQLADAGLEVKSCSVTTEFRFDDFACAWKALAGVTTAALDQSIQDQAKAAVRALMWPDQDGPRNFVNQTQIITATKTT